ncbi:MAG TPA: HipA domain-containing protein, partial [Opitutales bacterium]|nr:HipA domain-containing protein [Opitutales bacterium]
LLANPERWSSDEILIALLSFGADLPGSYMIGRDNMDTFLQTQNASAAAIAEASRADAYPSLAEEAASGEPPGSSAGGEQPKFTSTVQGETGIRQVLVKFSGERDSPVGLRWADLLVAEHLAAETLAAAGIPAATGTLVEAQNRTFLEVPRFDRVGAWGRRPVATLEALDAGLVGSGAALWGEAIPALLEQGFVGKAEALCLETAHQFGLLIGNDDMHLGNLAFHLAPELPLRPAPIYDMLPMQYRPGTQGDLPSHPVRVPPARPEDRDARNRALPLAREYWHRLAKDPRPSEDFRRIAAANAGMLPSS